MYIESFCLKIILCKKVLSTQEIFIYIDRMQKTFFCAPSTCLQRRIAFLTSPDASCPQKKKKLKCQCLSLFTLEATIRSAFIKPLYFYQLISVLVHFLCIMISYVNNNVLCKCIMFSVLVHFLCKY